MSYPRRLARVLAACGFVLLLASVGQAVTLYTQNFDVNDTANWTVNGGPADEAANFFFDYSQAGIPSAPSSTGGSTRGLNLQANMSAGVLGGFSVSPTGKNFSDSYKLRFDWWSNFNGPAPAGGNGSTQLSTFGVGTSGTVVQWPGGVQDSIWFAATGDGNASTDWRAFSSAAPTGYAANSGVYAAGTSVSPDSRNSVHPHYAGFGSLMAPSAQRLSFPQQTGTTVVGSAAFEWHAVEIAKLGPTVTWKVDGLPIATVTAPLSGGNIFFGHSDTNATSSSDINDVNLLFTLIDNVVVSSTTLGDFDENDEIELTDYLNLSSHLHTNLAGLPAAQAYLMGDMTLDQVIDGRDFVAFRIAYDNANGTGAFVAMLNAIPEPSTGLLAALGCGAGSFLCRLGSTPSRRRQSN